MSRQTCHRFQSRCHIQTTLARGNGAKGTIHYSLGISLFVLSNMFTKDSATEDPYQKGGSYQRTVRRVKSRDSQALVYILSKQLVLKGSSTARL